MAFSLRGFFGPSDVAERERDDEVVEKLVLRLESNSSFEDRRDALKALRAMAKVSYFDVILYMEAFILELSSNSCNSWTPLLYQYPY